MAFVPDPLARRLLGSSQQGAWDVLRRLTEAGIVQLDKTKWPRVCVATELLQAIEMPVAAESGSDPADAVSSVGEKV
jgi:hypothetical protein